MKTITNQFLVKPLIILCFLLFGITKSYSQYVPPDSVLAIHPLGCGTSPQAIADYGTTLWPITPGSPSITWSGPIDTCGHFLIYYDDLLLSTHKGFNDATYGTCMQSTLCGVLNYISTILDLSRVSTPITIHVMSLEGALYPSNPYNDILALGTPQFGYSGSRWLSQGVFDGKAFKHITSGTDPDPTQFDGTITVNFDGSPYVAGGGAVKDGGTFYWACDTNSLTHCKYDLYSVLLHEMTHVLGFISNIRIDSVTHRPIAAVDNSYSLYDHTYLYESSTSLFWNNAPPTWTPLVDRTYLAHPIITATIDTVTIKANIWYYNLGQFAGTNSANTNQPVYCGVTPYEHYVYGSNWPDNYTSYLSHPDLTPFSYTTRTCAAPGLQQAYVMEPFSLPGVARRVWTVPEMRILVGMTDSTGKHYQLHNSPPSYTINGVTSDSLIVSNNHPPINKQQNTDGFNITSNYDGIYPDYYYVYGATSVYPDFQQAVDTIITNTTGHNTWTYNVTADANIKDPDGDPVTIVPNTLYNIRGCDSNGNDHKQLSLNAGNTKVTFTARRDFIGLAQFGFYITDGKEAGAYVVKTIWVGTGNNFNNTSNQNTPLGDTEKVLNGGYEQGTEVRTTPTNENAFNTMYDYNFKEGNYYTGCHFADAHPLESVSTGGSAFSGVVIKGSYKNCDSGTGPHAFGLFDAGSPTEPAPNGTSDYRYHFLRETYNYFTIASSGTNYASEPVAYCTPYLLKFDVNFAEATGLSSYTIKVGFSNAIVQPPAANTYNFSFPITFVPSYSGWQTITVPFWYCGTVPTGQMYMNFEGDYHYVLLDNVSLTHNPSPPAMTVALAASNNPICNGSSTTITPTVTNPSCTISYLWSTGATTSTITVSPSATTAYSVTVTDGCGVMAPAHATDTIKVNPNPTVTINYIISCSDTATATASASGGASPYTYSWAPSGGTNATASGLSVGTYTVTVHDHNGCATTTSVTITAISCCTATGSCPDITNDSSSHTGTFNNKYLTCSPAINGIFIVNNNFTISNDESIKMGAGAEILVKSGNTLTITGTGTGFTRLWACGNMWQGIVLQPNAKLVINHHCIIEDAIQGVYAQANNSTGYIVLDTMTMNDNYQDVAIGAQTNGYTLDMQKDSLTCRADGAYSPGYLKAPYLYNETYQGVFLNYVRGTSPITTIGTPGSSGVTNYFANMNFGVYADSSDFAVYNNYFYHLVGPGPCGPGGCPPLVGIAVYGLAGFGVDIYNTYRTAIIGAPNSLNIYANTMSQCYRGVDLTSYVWMSVVNNVMTNTYMGGSPNLGDHGVYLKLYYNNQLDIQKNIITNYGTAIHLSRTYNGLGLNSDDNIISNTLTVTGTGNMSYGILAENTSAQTIENGYPLRIDSNTVNKAAYCILVRNMYNDHVYVNENSKLHVATFTPTTNITEAGVELDNNTESGSSNFVQVSNNQNIYDSISIVSSTPCRSDTDVMGIHSYLSTQMYIECNSMYNIGQCLRFEGSCLGQKVYDNNMATSAGTKCFDGFVLWKSAQIGTQGSSSFPIGDVWGTGTNIAHTQTYNYSSPQPYLYSPLWLLTGTLPTNNSSDPVGVVYTYNNTGALNIATSGSNPPCPSTTSPHERIHPLSEQEDLDAIVHDSVPFSIYIASSQYLNKQSVLEKINQDTTLMNGDTALQNFNTNAMLANMGKIYMVRKYIGQGNMGMAIATNNAITPTNTIEQYHQIVNDIYLHTFLVGTDTASSTQINNLWAVAKGCPLIDGRAVFEARAMLNRFLNASFQFTDSCVENEHKAMKQSGNGDNDAMADVRVYPNPANTLLNIQVKLKQGEVAHICLYNSIGQLVQCVELQNNLTSLPITTLAAGIYLYRVLDENNNVLKTDKQMIIH